MLKINKILKPRYLLVLLVLGGGALFTVLQATSNQCVSTANGDLTEQTTFGTYQGSVQTGCGSDLTLDYLINSGTTVTWDGSSGALQGEMEIESGGTLRVEGDVTLNSPLPFQNSGVLRGDGESYTDTSFQDNNTEITTLAGKLENYANGTGENAEFRSPYKLAMIGTDIYVMDDNRIRVLDSTTGTVTTLPTTGDDYNYIQKWTSNGTDIYFYSFEQVNVGGNYTNYYKLYKLTPQGVVSELDLEDGSGAIYTINSDIRALASDGTDLFVSTGSGGSTQFLRIALQTGTVTPYTTGGDVNNFSSDGFDKIGDSLFSFSYSKIFKIELAGTSATVSEVSIDFSGVSSNSYMEFRQMTSYGEDLYLSSGMMHDPDIFRVALSTGQDGTTTGTPTLIEPTFTGASYYNTGLEVHPNINGFATDGTALYVSDSNNKLIRKIDLTTSNITTKAGKLDNFADGTGENAEFRSLEKIALNGDRTHV